jgi:hypothetical protein
MPLIRQTILTMFMGPDPEQGLPEQGPEIPMEQSPQPMGMA